MRYIFIFSMLLLSCQSEQHRVIKVHDGDTVTLEDGSRIRIAEIDCPELNQHYGIEAKNFTANFLLGKTVNVKIKEKDKYGRKVASIFIRGSNFSDILIVNGMAHATKWSGNRLKNEYYEATRNKVGLFRYPYELPFIFRKKH